MVHATCGRQPQQDLRFAGKENDRNVDTTFPCRRGVGIAEKYDEQHANGTGMLLQTPVGWLTCCQSDKCRLVEGVSPTWIKP
eukprot:1182608-Prorocentrum_minimum.AAC.3